MADLVAWSGCGSRALIDQEVFVYLKGKRGSAPKQPRFSLRMGVAPDVVGSGTVCRGSGTPARQKTAKNGRPTFRSRKRYHHHAVDGQDDIGAKW